MRHTHSVHPYQCAPSQWVLRYWEVSIRACLEAHSHWLAHSQHLRITRVSILISGWSCAVNSAADYTAAAALQDEEGGRRSRGRSIDWRARTPLHRRRHSADFTRRLGRQHNLAGLGRQSLDVRLLPHVSSDMALIARVPCTCHLQKALVMKHHHMIRCHHYLGLNAGQCCNG